MDSVLAMKLRCESTTPRGLPVEPELKSSAAGSPPPPQAGVRALDQQSSSRVQMDAAPNDARLASSSTTCAAFSSHFSQAGAGRASTKAKRIRVRSATARQSAGVSPGETGTATQPACIAPRYAATQNIEFSATTPTHSPRSAPDRTRNVATAETAKVSSRYECSASRVINAGRPASLPASSRSDRK